jgi:hypothetical protein
MSASAAMPGRSRMNSWLNTRAGPPLERDAAEDSRRPERRLSSAAPSREGLPALTPTPLTQRRVAHWDIRTARYAPGRAE